TGKELRTLENFSGPVHSLAFGPQGNLLASASWSATNDTAADRLVRIWDTRTWRELRSLTLDFGGFIGVAFSPDGRRLAAAGETSVILLEPADLRPSPVAYDHDVIVTGVALSRDGKHLVSSDVNGEARIWDLTDQ